MFEVVVLAHRNNRRVVASATLEIPMYILLKTYPTSDRNKFLIVAEDAVKQYVGSPPY